MLNQVSLTGRINQIENNDKNIIVMLEIYLFDDDETEYIPVVINEETRNRIGRLRCGDLTGITGRLKFENDSIKVLADRIGYVG